MMLMVVWDVSLNDAYKPTESLLIFIHQSLIFNSGNSNKVKTRFNKSMASMICSTEANYIFTSNVTSDIGYNELSAFIYLLYKNRILV